MPTRAEMLGDGTIRGKEALGVAGGLKPLQAALPLTRGLVGVLRLVIQIPMLTMFHPWKELSFCCSVAL